MVDVVMHQSSIYWLLVDQFVLCEPYSCWSRFFRAKLFQLYRQGIAKEIFVYDWFARLWIGKKSMKEEPDSCRSRTPEHVERVWVLLAKVWRLIAKKVGLALLLRNIIKSVLCLVATSLNAKKDYCYATILYFSSNILFSISHHYLYIKITFVLSLDKLKQPLADVCLSSI